MEAAHWAVFRVSGPRCSSLPSAARDSHERPSHPTPKQGRWSIRLTPESSRFQRGSSRLRRANVWDASDIREAKLSRILNSVQRSLATVQGIEVEPILLEHQPHALGVEIVRAFAL
jgi:hypothetical protein